MSTTTVPEQVSELLARRYGGGVTVTNCVIHAGLDITKRGDDCPRCLADARNVLHRAIAANEWLNQWKEDAESVLRGDSFQESSPKEIE